MASGCKRTGLPGRYAPIHIRIAAIHGKSERGRGSATVARPSIGNRLLHRGQTVRRTHGLGSQGDAQRFVRPTRFADGDGIRVGEPRVSIVFADADRFECVRAREPNGSGRVD